MYCQNLLKLHPGCLCLVLLVKRKSWMLVQITEALQTTKDKNACILTLSGSFREAVIGYTVTYSDDC